jgi:uncharacterized protein (DUF362 family)
LLPDKKAPILLKPNLNSNMNALTGNTTDLRLVAAVIEFLKDAGIPISPSARVRTAAFTGAT